MRKIVLSVFIIFFLLASPVYVYAQEMVESPEPPEGLESCFDYYDYGKVRVQMSPDRSTYGPNSRIKLQGTVTNSNTFPLVAMTIYAHVKRINASESFIQDGHFLVDRVRLVKKLNFLPGESKWVTAELPVLETYPNGKYQIQYFVFSENGFHYGGRPFLEEDTAGYATFSVSGSIDPDIYFDLSSLRVDNTQHHVRETIAQYNEDSISFEIRLVDRRTVKTPFSIHGRWFRFEDTFDSLMVKEDIYIVDTANPVLQMTFSPPEPGAYVFLAEVDAPIRTLFKYRFARAGSIAPELRMNDLGVNTYPASSQGKAYVCFHSPTNAETPETQVTLSLLNSDKTVVDEKIVSQRFPSEVWAISLLLTRLSSPDDFWVRAKFSQPQNPAKSREVTVHYSCSIFSNSLSGLSFAYKEDRRALLFTATDGCSQPLRQGGHIDALRIMRGKKVVKEAYNLDTIPANYSMSDLSPGAYVAQVRVGDRITDQLFTVPALGLKQTKKIQKRIILIIVGIVVTTVFLVYSKRVLRIWKLKREGGKTDD